MSPGDRTDRSSAKPAPAKPPSAEHEPGTMWDPASDDPPFPAPPERGRWAELALQVCGVIAMASPLALWVAWTETILLSVLATSLVCIAVCWLIVHFGR